MSPNPEFVLVPGGWQGPEAFAPTTALLEKAGHKVHGVSLPSIGASPHHKSNEQDVLAVRLKITEVLSSGKDVIVIMHSYGGIVGCEALASYMDELEKGGKDGLGRVLRLVFCTAFCLPEGEGLMHALQGKPLPWFIINEDQSEVRPGTPKEIFYSDISDAEAASHIAHLKPMGYGTFFTELTVAPWKVIPSTYIVCSEDKAIPLFAQEAMIAYAQLVAPQSFDVVERCDSGHSPFLSQPVWLTEKLVKAAADSVQGRTLGF